MKAIHLTKRFPGKLAVSNLQFQLLPGRLTALLGPNGAGKTTTMRLLTGFLNPTSGKVEVEGKDISLHRQEIQGKIGYLPENGPSYRDLTVRENLDFFARSRGLFRSRRLQSIHKVIEELNLGEVRNSVIGNLSKGFKQRVALASVLLGEPSYLILDEPSYGLDPKQMSQIRSLIRELSKERTVLISTHSLEEVEEICDHVIILARGEIVADSSVRALRKKDKLFLEVKIEESDFVRLLSEHGFNNIKKLKISEDNFTEYELMLGDRRSEEVYLILSSNQIIIREMRKSEESLHAIFNSITGI